MPDLPNFLHKSAPRNPFLGFPSSFLFLLVAKVLIECWSNLKVLWKGKDPKKVIFQITQPTLQFVLWMILSLMNLEGISIFLTMLMSNYYATQHLFQPIFTREQFHVGLRLPLSSLVRQFLHYTQIPASYVHLNSIRILMGCSILNQLFNLKLSLLDILFIYTIKLNKWGKHLVFACRWQLQLVTNLPNSKKGWAIGCVIVFGEWEFSTPDPRDPYPLNHTLKLLSKWFIMIYSKHGIDFLFSFFFFQISLVLLLDKWK